MGLNRYKKLVRKMVVAHKAAFSSKKFNSGRIDNPYREFEKISRKAKRELRSGLREHQRANPTFIAWLYDKFNEAVSFKDMT
jgi:hypothetical protein